MQQKCLEKLREFTRHSKVKIVNSGNAALFAALFIVKKVNNKPFILIPDQGGWFSYKTYPKLLGFEIKEIKTKQGIIDLKDLEEKAHTGGALLLPSFAGYFAEHHLFQISHICQQKGCILIEDASGAIGDEKLCNGQFSDIIVGSFNRWKPVDLGTGGFISVKTEDYFKKTQEIYSIMKPNIDYSQLYNKLSSAKKRLNFFFDKCRQIKSDLNGFEILHPEKRGINVIVKYKDESEKQRIADYCENNKYEYLVCPKYIRVNEEAISIEVKRLQQNNNKI